METECLRRIAEAKGIPLESVGLETTLESIGVDSLDRVSFAFDLEEQYSVELPEHDLQRILTIGDVAAAVQRALVKKQQARDEPTGTA
ncbi:acyl carrier protein [Terriglobus sp.]|uniref:acyl carrier protein n=1 Tax=Terriglobus sp. TaxID=1889013 RepID=UPI003B00F97E